MDIIGYLLIALGIFGAVFNGFFGRAFSGQNPEQLTHEGVAFKQHFNGLFYLSFAFLFVGMLFVTQPQTFVSVAGSVVFLFGYSSLIQSFRPYDIITVLIKAGAPSEELSPERISSRQRSLKRSGTILILLGLGMVFL